MPKTIRTAPPSAPQRAGFGLGPPAPISARAGENWALGGATGPIFWRRRPKSRLGCLVGGAAGDALTIFKSWLIRNMYISSKEGDVFLE